MSLLLLKDLRKLDKIKAYLTIGLIFINVVFFILYAYSLTPPSVLSYTKTNFALHVAKLSILGWLLSCVITVLFKKKQLTVVVSLLYLLCFWITPIIGLYRDTSSLDFLSLILWFKLLSQK